MKKLGLLIATAIQLSISFTENARGQNWQTADRGSAGIAPLPENEKQAVVQVYAARTVGMKGNFAVHTWIATKEENARSYETYQVIGYRAKRGLDVVVVQESVPDGRWFGAEPQLLRDLRGPAATSAIQKIRDAAKSYPYQKEYRIWPGPNSNSFVSYIIRRTPEIGVELPANAVGKDWIDQGALVGVSEGRTGFQISLLGVLGFTLGLGEGIEFNILGLSFGVDFLRPALKLPAVGRVGMQDAPVFAPADAQPVVQDKIQPLVIEKKPES